MLFSPRMWRCFRYGRGRNVSRTIFSTYVEVFPTRCKSDCKHGNFLHVCGGVSRKPPLIGRTRRFSPRMWRCFLIAWQWYYCQHIFSTYVEVFLWSFRKSRSVLYFLHVCGGVSLTDEQLRRALLFSPRMWRCFSYFKC